MSLLDVDSLTITYRGSRQPVVQDLCFTLGRGDTLGLVGESGSGKTQTAMALLGLLPASAQVDGSVRFAGEELLGAGPSVLNRIRAMRIAMVFQDPGAALNPYVRIGRQIKRILVGHRICGGDEARERTLDMLGKVGLPDPERQYRAFPHELSGGMRQRALIGAALLGQPDLLVADEPTTALDVTVQAQILELIRNLHAQTNSALLLITHDLGVIAGNCERMLVMENGELVEEGATREVFSSPQHATTRALISAAPDISSEVLAVRPAADADAVLAIEELGVSFRERHAVRGTKLAAVRPLSFTVKKGETVAVVGESGSGKTSLVRALLGLIPPSHGQVSFLGKALPGNLAERPNVTRRNLQMVFQHPLASLNPAMPVGDIVAEPLRVHSAGKNPGGRHEEVVAMLSRVGLSESFASRYPHELSGGQAQRVAIARALILAPMVLICDEAVAALDGTVRAEVLEVLLAEQQRSGLAIIFITHDLAVVRQISHRILVMYMGRLCEVAENEALFRRPRHPYTKALLLSALAPRPGARGAELPLSGESSSLLHPPAGCPFHPRCRHAVAICSEQVPHAHICEGAIVACHRAAELDLGYAHRCPRR